MPVSKNAIFSPLKPRSCHFLMQQLGCYFSANNFFLTLRLKFALVCEICPQILYWICSICQKKNHSNAAGISPPNWITYSVFWIPSDHVCWIISYFVAGKHCRALRALVLLARRDEEPCTIYVTRTQPELSGQQQTLWKLRWPLSESPKLNIS